jgi:GAF domain-containing protein
VPRIGDWCTVALVGESGAADQLATAHADPAKVSLAADIRRRWPPNPDTDQGIYQVLRTGETLLVAEVTEAMLDAAPLDAEYRQALKRLGLRSVMIVPLLVRGSAIGTISFISAESGRRYGANDVMLAEEIAPRRSHGGRRWRWRTRGCTPTPGRPSRCAIGSCPSPRTS